MSIKDSERLCRETTTPIEVNVLTEDTPLPVQMERFWPSNDNKHKLQDLLHQKMINLATGKPSNSKLVVSSFSSTLSEASCITCCNGCTSNVPELCVNIEEADTRIIPHAMHAVEHGIERIIVLSADTDVFVLLLYYWNSLHLKGLR